VMQGGFERLHFGSRGLACTAAPDAARCPIGCTAFFARPD
jgi:hypothetical protein